MNKKYLIIGIILIVLTSAISLHFLINKKNNIKKGEFFDENTREKIGSCTYEFIESDSFGGGVHKTDYYFQNKTFIGTCRVYSGPGASGGAGWSCPENLKDYICNVNPTHENYFK